MTKTRVIETNEGIQDELTVEVFDSFARVMRDRGWNGVDGMIASGIRGGEILEIGPGPGYVGLELVKKLGAGFLTGLEISPAMLAYAKKNAAQAGVDARYVEGDAQMLPFEDESFDNVISNGSLHEWENPQGVCNEIYRVLRPGGRYCITDLRRDAGRIKEMFIYFSTKPKSMRPGLLTSLRASYTAPELRELLRHTKLHAAGVTNDFFGLCVAGVKE